jgi:hypothetical protein
MAPNARIADFANRGLKLETAAAVEDLFRDLDLEHIEKIVLTGNTFGVAAGEALGKVIRKMPNLEVSHWAFRFLERHLICLFPGGATRQYLHLQKYRRNPTCSHVHLRCIGTMPQPHRG